MGGRLHGLQAAWAAGCRLQAAGNNGWPGCTKCKVECIALIVGSFHTGIAACHRHCHDEVSVVALGLACMLGHGVSV